MTNVSISPRSRAIAEALLSAAEYVGLDPSVVTTTRTGYIVPVEVAERYGAMVRGETEPVEQSTDAEGEPDDTWKNADIEKYAGDHGIDLGGATKKADMLAAIATAKNKED